MARIESQIDLMHVPTPQAVIDRLRACLIIPDRCIALDPCCGTGEALRSLVPTGKTYGVELELSRGREAAGRLDSVLTCAMQEARISHDTFGLLLLNPPYDTSMNGRLERVFLDRCTKYLRPGGILVFIIKAKLYGIVSGILRQHYDVLHHWRFPDGYYDGPELAFGQTVLVARRRSDINHDVDPNFWRNTLQLGGIDDIDAHLQPMPETLEKRVPVANGQEPKIFVSGRLSEADMRSLLKTSPVPRFNTMPSRLGCGRPPVTLKQGHIALMLASGMIDGVYGDGPTLHVAKGTTVRQTTKVFKEDETAGGRPVLIQQTTDSFAIKIRALTSTGKIHEMLNQLPPPENAPEPKRKPERSRQFPGDYEQ